MILVSLAAVQVEGEHGPPASAMLRDLKRAGLKHAAANRDRAPLRGRHVAPYGAGSLRAPSPQLSVDEFRNGLQHARYAQKLTRGIEAIGPQTVATDCALAARRILAENGLTPKHPVELMAEAYGVAPEVP